MSPFIRAQLLPVLLALHCALASPPPEPAGADLHGLRISTGVAASVAGERRDVLVALRNVSPNLLRVRVGVLPGGSHLSPFPDIARTAHPLLLTIVVKSGTGAVQLLRYKAPSLLAGYTEPWELAIAPGESRSVRLPGSRYDGAGVECLAARPTEPCRVWVELNVPREECAKRPPAEGCWSGRAVSNAVAVR